MNPYCKDIQDVLEDVGSSAEGLSAQQAQERLVLYLIWDVKNANMKT